ncbi:MAG: hypothetical protein K2Q33_02850 [Gammaproteobacteria bacterium]|nr:hypothetical protein [Gammaproteobacteria bacterium]
MEELTKELLLCMEAIKIKAFDSSELATEILETTSKVLEIDEEDIKSQSHNREICDARKIAINLIVEHTILPYRSIGLLIGDRDHSTIHYNYSTAEELKQDKRFLRKFNAVKQQLGL